MPISITNRRTAGQKARLGINYFLIALSLYGGVKFGVPAVSTKYEAYQDNGRIEQLVEKHDYDNAIIELKGAEFFKKSTEQKKLVADLESKIRQEKYSDILQLVKSEKYADAGKLMEKYSTGLTEQQFKNIESQIKSTGKEQIEGRQVILKDDLKSLEKSLKKEKELYTSVDLNTHQELYSKNKIGRIVEVGVERKYSGDPRVFKVRFQDGKTSYFDPEKVEFYIAPKQKAEVKVSDPQTNSVKAEPKKAEVKVSDTQNNSVKVTDPQIKPVQKAGVGTFKENVELKKINNEVKRIQKGELSNLEKELREININKKTGLTRVASLRRLEDKYRMNGAQTNLEDEIIESYLDTLMSRFSSEKRIDTKEIYKIFDDFSVYSKANNASDLRIDCEKFFKEGVYTFSLSAKITGDATIFDIERVFGKSEKIARILSKDNEEYVKRMNQMFDSYANRIIESRESRNESMEYSDSLVRSLARLGMKYDHDISPEIIKIFSAEK